MNVSTDGCMRSTNMPGKIPIQNATVGILDASTGGSIASGTSAADGYFTVANIPAGQSYEAPLQPGQAARIFTGAPLPPGADAIVIQEDTEADGRAVVVKEPAQAGAYVRPAGLDFECGQVLLHRGRIRELPGTWRALIDGKVGRKWAEKHHSEWYKGVEK